MRLRPLLSIALALLPVTALATNPSLPAVQSVTVSKNLERYVVKFSSAPRGPVELVSEFSNSNGLVGGGAVRLNTRRYVGTDLLSQLDNMYDGGSTYTVRFAACPAAADAYSNPGDIDDRCGQPFTKTITYRPKSTTRKGVNPAALPMQFYSGHTEDYGDEYTKADSLVRITPSRRVVAKAINVGLHECYGECFIRVVVSKDQTGQLLGRGTAFTNVESTDDNLYGGVDVVMDKDISFEPGQTYTIFVGIQSSDAFTLLPMFNDANPLSSGNGVYQAIVWSHTTDPEDTVDEGYGIAYGIK
jgi:hypothetical protein